MNDMARKVIIPKDALWSYSDVTIAAETPVGVVENKGAEITFDGRRYQSLAPPLFMDMDTGEEVEVVLKGW
jgi:hypothetical protein